MHSRFPWNACRSSAPARRRRTTSCASATENRAAPGESYRSARPEPATALFVRIADTAGLRKQRAQLVHPSADGEPPAHPARKPASRAETGTTALAATTGVESSYFYLYATSN